LVIPAREGGGGYKAIGLKPKEIVSSDVIKLDPTRTKLTLRIPETRNILFLVGNGDQWYPDVPKADAKNKKKIHNPYQMNIAPGVSPSFRSGSTNYGISHIRPQEDINAAQKDWLEHPEKYGDELQKLPGSEDVLPLSFIDGLRMSKFPAKAFNNSGAPWEAICKKMGTKEFKYGSAYNKSGTKGYLKTLLKKMVPEIVDQTVETEEGPIDAIDDIINQFNKIIYDQGRDPEVDPSPEKTFQETGRHHRDNLFPKKIVDVFLANGFNARKLYVSSIVKQNEEEKDRSKERTGNVTAGKEGKEVDDLDQMSKNARVENRPDEIMTGGRLRLDRLEREGGKNFKYNKEEINKRLVSNIENLRNATWSPHTDDQNNPDSTTRARTFNKHNSVVERDDKIAYNSEYFPAYKTYSGEIGKSYESMAEKMGRTDLGENDQLKDVIGVFIPKIQANAKEGNLVSALAGIDAVVDAVIHLRNAATEKRYKEKVKNIIAAASNNLGILKRLESELAKSLQTPPIIDRLLDNIKADPNLQTVNLRTQTFEPQVSKTQKPEPATTATEPTRQDYTRFVGKRKIIPNPVSTTPTTAARTSAPTPAASTQQDYTRFVGKRKAATVPPVSAPLTTPTARKANFAELLRKRMSQEMNKAEHYSYMEDK
jgi:hypothetical protein